MERFETFQLAVVSRGHGWGEERAHIVLRTTRVVLESKARREPPAVATSSIFSQAKPRHTDFEPKRPRRRPIRPPPQGPSGCSSVRLLLLRLTLSRDSCWSGACKFRTGRPRVVHSSFPSTLDCTQELGGKAEDRFRSGISTESPSAAAVRPRAPLSHPILPSPPFLQ